jgi:hypothetical protein
MISIIGGSVAVGCGGSVGWSVGCSVGGIDVSVGTIGAVVEVGCEK